MAKSEQDSEKEEKHAKQSEKKRRADTVPAHDQDSEAPRTAEPPGEEPEWRRDEGC